ncbi:hypothetical protein BpHYR1_053240 [Brachionus plicatilis]|uniref:Uncharacterized protein n=1 Tax=Brachionus plicatilis TaxID=10195 RepID=A0A3M7SH95_BRAPC|nr:hypothetical protein BpHYR1_053240 [Brachionus plicatilis]
MNKKTFLIILKTPSIVLFEYYQASIGPIFSIFLSIFFINGSLKSSKSISHPYRSLISCFFSISWSVVSCSVQVCNGLNIILSRSAKSLANIASAFE